MWDNMGIADKFRDGDWRRKIASEEMKDNGDIRDIGTGRQRKQQRRRRGTDNRTYAGTTEIAIFGQRL